MSLERIHAFAILAYRDSPYLEECIQSLKQQTVKSEIFISTATPSSFLTSVSKKYHIPLCVNKNSGGITSDWSFAYNVCKAQYVTLAHQDDVYLPLYTESCLSAVPGRKSSDNVIIFTNYRELFEAKIRNYNLNLFIKRMLLLSFLFKQNIHSTILKRIILSFGTPIPCSGVMYHKEYIGSFSFSKIFQCNMDWDAWIRLSKIKGSFIYIRKGLLIHRIHSDSQTSLQIKNKIRKKEDTVIFERLWPNSLSRLLSKIYSLSLKSNKTFYSTTRVNKHGRN